MSKRVDVESAAEAYLELLDARGIEYLFGNAGTDFAPLIEALARRDAHGRARPRPITVPHEIPAVAMAHGYAMVTGRPAAVMVHVIVGAANALSGIMNAARAHVPMLFTAGRTPLTDGPLPGARDRHIHWGQESFDQGAHVREFVKWDYELRMGSQLETVVDRALAIATAEPAGPVYLSLPREVLAERLTEVAYAEAPRQSAPGPVVADAASVARAAALLAGARCPIAITKSLGRDPGAVAPFVAVAERLGLPVFEHYATHLSFPQDHPLHAGFDPGAALEEADVILVAEADVPWFPKVKAPRPNAVILQLGHDPLHLRYPIRGFPVDLALPGAPRLTLRALDEALAGGRLDTTVIEERRARWAAEHARQRAAWSARGRAAAGAAPIEMAWVSRALSEALDASALVVNEYDLDQTQACFTAPGSYFGAPQAAGLGWGLGAALGAKLAAPERTVVACLGDGAYIFGAPTAAHWTARAYALPVLTVVFNNRGWNAVKRAVTGHAPDGWAARARPMPLAELDPPPDYAMVARASGGWAERVENPAELPAAIARALLVVREERRQALLDVICRKA